MGLEAVMDVLVCGVPRSGTTMMAGLMTKRPFWVVWNEPAWVQEKQMVVLSVKQTREVGWGWQQNWKKEEVERRAEKMKGWGVKQVFKRKIEMWMDLFPPQKVVVMARDMRMVAASMHEKAMKIGRGTLEHRMYWVQQSAKAVLGLLEDERTIVVRYEKFVGSQEERWRVAEELGWPLAGDPNLMAGASQRRYEVEKHKHQVTAVSAERVLTADEAWYADRMLKRDSIRKLHEAFGYG